MPAQDKDKPNAKPNAAAFGQMRARLAQMGVSQAQITAAIGIGAQGRTRAEIADALIAWCNTLKKA